MPKPHFVVQKIGSDFELFLKDTLTGQPVTAIGILGGTKAEPRPILEGHGYAIQEDNVMAEMNIPPAADANEFVKSINRALSYLWDFTAPLFLEPVIAGSQVFPVKALEHPQAMNIGCEPDYCVWTRSINEIDKTSELLKTLRTTGGHIHMSYLVDGQTPSLEHNEMMVKANDLFLGVPSVLLDNDTERKKLYGKAGAFRPKSYGHEYRVLSSFWLASTTLQDWAFTESARSAHCLNEGEVTFDEVLGNKIVTCINNNDKKLAEALVKTYGLKVPVA